MISFRRLDLLYISKKGLADLNDEILKEKPSISLFMLFLRVFFTNTLDHTIAVLEKGQDILIYF